MPNESSLWVRLGQRFNLRDLIAQASQPPLIDRGFGLIYDTERDLTWLQDVNYAKTGRQSPDGQMTWPAAMAWVRALSYHGIRGWRLPDAHNGDGSGPPIGTDCAGTELGHLYLDVFQNHPHIIELKNGRVPCIFWTRTEASAEKAYAFDLFGLRQGLLWKDPFVERFAEPPLSGPVFSWAVHDGDVAADLRWRWLRNFISWGRISRGRA